MIKGGCWHVAMRMPRILVLKVHLRWSITQELRAMTSESLVTPRLLNNLYSFCEKSCFVVVVVNYSWYKISWSHCIHVVSSIVHLMIAFSKIVHTVWLRCSRINCDLIASKFQKICEYDFVIRKYSFYSFTPKWSVNCYSFYVLSLLSTIFEMYPLLLQC